MPTWVMGAFLEMILNLGTGVLSKVRKLQVFNSEHLQLSEQILRLKGSPKLEFHR
jgi:hypothetical protein